MHIQIKHTIRASPLHITVIHLSLKLKISSNLLSDTVKHVCLSPVSRSDGSISNRPSWITGANFLALDLGCTEEHGLVLAAIRCRPSAAAARADYLIPLFVYSSAGCIENDCDVIAIVEIACHTKFSLFIFFIFFFVIGQSACTP